MSAQRKPSPPVVKLSTRTHAQLLQFSRDENRPNDRERFWKAVEADYARLRADQAAWSEYQTEVTAWDSLMSDGLENEPPYFTAEEERQIREQVAARTSSR